MVRSAHKRRRDKRGGGDPDQGVREGSEESNGQNSAGLRLISYLEILRQERKKKMIEFTKEQMIS